jgi:excisionase family DNA binding protein
MDCVPLMFTVEEVAAVLRVSKRTVYRWMDEEKLPSFRRGRTRRCTKEALEQLVGAKIQSSHLVAPQSGKVGQDEGDPTEGGATETGATTEGLPN